MVVVDEQPIDELLAKYPGQQAWLLPILHEVHHAYGYLSRDSIEAIAEHVGMTPAQVYGMITFYSEFRTEPVGETMIRFCHGPACYLRGLHKLERVAEAVLDLKVGETSKDGRITLEPVHCNGTCDVAPVMYVNGTAYGNLRPSDVRRILEEVKLGGNKE